MSTAEKKMKIFVGPVRPADALVGRLENDNATIKGYAEPCQAIGGMNIIANRSIQWGIRLDKDGSDPSLKKYGDRLQPNDKRYTGKVKFFKWGTEGGIPITTRYKAGCTSIDYDYQILQLGMRKFEEELEDNYLHLPFGEYSIFDSEEAKQLFLSTHHENQDSPSRSPEVMHGSLRMVKTFESTKSQVKSIEKEFEAIQIVKDAKTFEHLKVLQLILSEKTEIKYDESDETSLFENILLYAKKSAPDFMASVKAYEGRVSEVIERFRSYKAYDWTTNGRLMGGQDKKEILVDGIDAKGEDMVQYLFDFRFEPTVFEAIQKMILIAQKFK